MSLSKGEEAEPPLKFVKSKDEITGTRPQVSGRPAAAPALPAPPAARGVLRRRRRQPRRGPAGLAPGRGGAARHAAAARGPGAGHAGRGRPDPPLLGLGAQRAARAAGAPGPPLQLGAAHVRAPRRPRGRRGRLRPPAGPPAPAAPPCGLQGAGPGPAGHRRAPRRHGPGLLLHEGNVPRLFQRNLFYSQKRKYRTPRGKLAPQLGSPKFPLRDREAGRLGGAGTLLLGNY